MRRNKPVINRGKPSVVPSSLFGAPSLSNPIPPVIKEGNDQWTTNEMIDSARVIEQKLEENEGFEVININENKSSPVKDENNGML